MAIEGYVDEVTPTRIRGWVYDSAKPKEPVEVEIRRDGAVLATVKASGYRRDLKVAGKGNGRHAFVFEARGASADGELQARVKGTPFVLPRAGSGGVAQAASSGEEGKSAGGRLQFEFLHTLEFGLPEVAHGFTTDPVLADETTCVTRLLEALERTTRDAAARAPDLRDMWSELADTYHGPLLKLLRRRDVPGLSAYLRQVHAMPLTHGITQGEKAAKSLREKDEARRITAAKYVDRLVSLAEYLGILPGECVEQTGRWGENLHTPVEALAGAIERVLGFAVPVSNPPGGLFGMRVGEAKLTDRDVYALYAALRLLEVARMQGVATPSVVEIGGGAGGVAYYARKLGLGQYTIIDLPLVSLLQGYCLMCQLGPDAVALYGEPEVAAEKAAIRLLPTWAFAGEARTYDLLLNQDSFPEMHRDYATGYLQTAREKVRHFVLSINQEAQANQAGDTRQSVVQDLVRAAGGYQRIYRFRHWLRPGYIEELYRVG